MFGILIFGVICCVAAIWFAHFLVYVVRIIFLVHKCTVGWWICIKSMIEKLKWLNPPKCGFISDVVQGMHRWSIPTYFSVCIDFTHFPSYPVWGKLALPRDCLQKKLVTHVVLASLLFSKCGCVDNSLKMPNYVFVSPCSLTVGLYEGKIYLCCG